MRRYRILLIGLIVLCLFLLPIRFTTIVRSGAKQALTPLSAVLIDKGQSLRRLVISFRDIASLPAQNQDLQNRLTEQLAKNAQLQEVEHENALLRDQLKVSPQLSNIHLVAARVVVRNPVSFDDSVGIDRGSSAGVAVGQAVTLHGGLVGQITNVDKESARVQLITSGNALTQAQLQNSRERGVVRGGLRGLVLDLIPQDTTVTAGENIITSGLGGTLRSGIIVGTVVNVISKKNDIFQTIDIKPAVAFTQIDIVFVEVPQ